TSRASLSHAYWQGWGWSRRVARFRRFPRQIGRGAPYRWYTGRTCYTMRHRGAVVLDTYGVIERLESLKGGAHDHQDQADQSGYGGRLSQGRRRTAPARP